MDNSPKAQLHVLENLLKKSSLPSGNAAMQCILFGFSQCKCLPGRFQQSLSKRVILNKHLRSDSDVITPKV